MRSRNLVLRCLNFLAWHFRTPCISTRALPALAFPVVLLLFVSACQTTGTNNNAETLTPVKSPNDDRGYAYFELPNQMRVLVVSDPDADKAAAALDINIGSKHDPRAREGLAHFLEHMLFLGTEQYPEPGEYQDFIQQHGGSHNAFTAYEHTNYYFDIDAGFLEPALDRFSRFFVDPLFNSEYVEREKHAVDSEYQSRRKQDSMLQYDVLKTLTNPRHPFSKFSVGSLETLASTANANVRDDLIRFYQKYYSANLMTLVVIGKQSTDELKQLVIDRFSEVADHGVEPEPNNIPLYTPGSLPARVDIETEKDIRVLSLQFPIPDISPHYRSKPTSYIANLLGHEGRGSLLSSLKQRGWADSLSAGAGSLGEGYSSFSVSVNLTEPGMEHIDEIVARIFATIELIKQQGIDSWRYQEQSRLSQIDFQFQQQGANIGYASALAQRMHEYGVKDLLQAPYAMDNYQPNLIRDYLSYLRPDNLLLMLSAQGLQTDSETLRFNAHYARYPIDAQALTGLAENTDSFALALPEPNPFVPDRLTLLETDDSDQTPEKLYEKEGFTLWYEQDASFGAPRADFYFSLHSAHANASARNALLTQLWVRSVDEALNEFSYPARLAGLDYALYKHSRGFSVRISGYQDKQAVLLSEILARLKNSQPSETQFIQFKDEIARGLANQQKNAPYNQAAGKVSTALVHPSWTLRELSEALPLIELEDLKAFTPRLFERVSLLALANGNLDRRSALALARLLEKNLLAGAKGEAIEHSSVVKLSRGSPRLFLFEVEHPDSAILSYYQGKDKSMRTRAEFILLRQVLSAPFFQQLRTEAQLGYVVTVTSIAILDTPSIAFIVQSPNTPPPQLDQHIGRFIKDFAATLSSLDQQQFERHKQAILAQLMEQDQRLSQRTNRYWYEIDRENYSFDTREQLAEAIRALSLEDLRNAYRDNLLEDERLFTVVAAGQRFAATENETAGEPLFNGYSVFKDIKAIQRQSSYF